MESLSANPVKWGCGRDAWKVHPILSRACEDDMPITAKVRENQPGRTEPEFSVDLLLRSRYSAFGEAPAGVGCRGYWRLKLRGMLRVCVAGPRAPGDKARVT